MSDAHRYDTAVIDWGIGGLSVYREIRQLWPQRRIYYLSDAGEVPYGKLSAQRLLERLLEICEHLARLQIPELVVACNAASTAAPDLRDALARSGATLRVVDVITHGVEIVRATPHRRVGVIGGVRTIESGVYQHALATDRRQIVGRVAQPLSALIERGELATPELHATLDAILAPLRTVDALLLACTHYCAVTEAIAARLPGTEILDPAAATARALGAPARTEGAAHARFVTTGDPAQMRDAAHLAFGLTIAPEKWDAAFAVDQRDLGPTG